MDVSPAVLPDRELDARGLNCPLPILRTKKALNEMAGGQCSRCSYRSGICKGFQAFARQTGHELLDSSAADGEYRFLLRKKS